MIVLTEKRASFSNRVIYREGLINLKETKNLPALAKFTGVANASKYTAVVRNDTIFSTLKDMGLDPYINKMRNVVCEAPSMQEAPAIMSTIYQQFGVRSSVTITWEGKVKVYWSPETPADKAPALDYAKNAGLPPPNPRKYLA